MRHRLDQILAFVQTVEAGTITEAARRMNLAKSVVSRRVTELEDQLGTRLLTRSTRRVQPTDRGQLFYERARAILHELDLAAEAVSEDDACLAGSLRLAAPMSFGVRVLPGLLLPFLAAQPRLAVAVDLDDRMIDIAAEGFDLALRVAEPADSALVGRRLAAVRRLLVASPDCLARHGSPAAPEDLARLPVIGYANASGGRQVWRFRPRGGAGDAETVAVAPRLTMNNGELMAEAAAAGLGLALLPSFIVAEGLRAGRLVEVLAERRPPPLPLMALWPPTRHLSRAVRLLVDHLATAIGDPPSWDRALPP